MSTNDAYINLQEHERDKKAKLINRARALSEKKKGSHKMTKQEELEWFNSLSLEARCQLRKYGIDPTMTDEERRNLVIRRTTGTIQTVND